MQTYCFFPNKVYMTTKNDRFPYDKNVDGNKALNCSDIKFIYGIPFLHHFGPGFS